MLKAKDTEKLLKAAREAGLTTIRLTADFASEVMEASRQWNGLFTEREKLSTQNPYLVKLFFKNKGEIVSDK